MMTDQNRTIDLDFNMVKTVYGESRTPGTYVKDEDRSSIDSTLFLAEQDHLLEDHDRRLVRLESASRDGYGVYVYEYKRTFDWLGFRGVFPDDETEDPVYCPEFSEFVIRDETPDMNYMFVTRDSGMSFDLITDKAITLDEYISLQNNM